MTLIERMARALVGDERYDAMPERATYLQRQADINAEWHDREGLRASVRRQLEAGKLASPLMLREGWDALNLHNGLPKRDEVRDCWIAMIDAALAEGE